MPFIRFFVALAPTSDGDQRTDPVSLCLIALHSSILGSAERQHAIAEQSPQLIPHLLQLIVDPAHNDLARFMAMEVLDRQMGRSIGVAQLKFSSYLSPAFAGGQ